MLLQMDVRYKNIQSSAYTISILFGGIFIADVRHRVLILYHSPNKPKKNPTIYDVEIHSKNKQTNKIIIAFGLTCIIDG